MQANGETTIANGYNGHELSADEGRWFLVWAGLWIIALAALLPVLI